MIKMQVAMKAGEDKPANKGENTQQEPHNEITHMAIGVLALLRNDQKKAYHKVKQLIKLNKEMAFTVLTSEIDGWTPVHACALKGTKKLLKSMLQAGIQVNCTMGQPEGLPGGCTLLHVAANRTDRKVLDYLLHHGADVNARDSDGNTALFYAKKSSKDDVRLLVNYGATLEDTAANNSQLLHQTHNPGRCVKDSTRKLHGSTPSLKYSPGNQSQTTETIHKTQPTETLHRQRRQDSSSGDFVRIASSTANTSSSAKSNFLTVPSVKFYSSSPCLHIQSHSVDNSGKDLSDSTSKDITRCSLSRKNKGYNNNNNNSSTTDLNSKGELKASARTDYASCGSLSDKLSF